MLKLYNVLLIFNKRVARIFVFLFNLIIDIIIYKNKILKVCICTIGKLENNYIQEFIEHYRKYRIDKIYLYDNNDIDGETFLISPKYVKAKYIEIIDWRGQKTQQLKFFEDCYKSNNKKYDWLMFYDIDEFINITNYSNIHQYLSQRKFNKCQIIYLNWRLHTDNNKMFYENKKLFERFPKYYDKNDYIIGKSIIKGNIENINFDSPHYIDRKLFTCFDVNYIEHYEFKSTEEFIRKITIKGDVRFENNFEFKLKRVLRYFRFNKMTLDKINYIADNIKINKTYLISLLDINSSASKF